MTDIYIRQLGDKILHAIPRWVDFKHDASKIAIDKAIMFEQLNLTGGVGIAANQCSQIINPLQMMIVGVADSELRELIKQRYPGEIVPEPELFFNPKILEYNGESYFPINGEGCLSVFGGLRGKTKRFTEIVLQHEKTNGEIIQERITGFKAHIAQHECDHLSGIVYLQKILNDLSPEQLHYLLTTIESFSAVKTLSLEDLTPPALTFDRDTENNVVIIPEALQSNLPHLNKTLWEGLVCELKKRERLIG